MSTFEKFFTFVHEIQPKTKEIIIRMWIYITIEKFPINWCKIYWGEWYLWPSPSWRGESNSKPKNHEKVNLVSKFCFNMTLDHPCQVSQVSLQWVLPSIIPEIKTMREIKNCSSMVQIKFREIRQLAEFLYRPCRDPWCKLYNQILETKLQNSKLFFKIYFN